MLVHIQKSLLASTLLVLLLAGCNEQQATNGDTVSPASEQAALPPALVTIMVLKPEAVTLVDELPGRVSAYRTAEIRPQVGGIVEKRLFDQGTEVTVGQPLFQIAAATFKADVQVADAALQRAQASLYLSKRKFDRASQLLPNRSISLEAYDNASTELSQAKASVAEAQATLDRRQLDLDFATVRAPISGRIGPALVTEGALVAAANASPLATIQQIDQVYVDVRQPAAQFDVIRDAISSGLLDASAKQKVEVLSASGKPYPVTGEALFSDINVDPGTGNVTVRVLVPNPGRILLPGMYVRAKLPRGVRKNALLIPQEAIVRDATGKAQLLVVGADSLATRRDVELGEVLHGRYIITAGVKPGEIVIAQGQDRVTEGVPVQATPIAADTPPSAH